jgi:hypothetical protein
VPAATGIGVLFWAASTALDLIVTPIYLNSQHVGVALTDWVPLRSVLLNLLAYTMWAIFGVGLGSLFRSQVGAVVTRMVIYLGGIAAALAIVRLVYMAYAHTWVLGAAVAAPSVASLVMVGYAIVLGMAGVLRTRRRDV